MGNSDKRLLKVSLLLCAIALAFILTAVMIAPTISDESEVILPNARMVNLYTANMLEVGDYIREFGTYRGRDLSWRVIAKDDNGVMLRTEYVLSNADGSADTRPYSDLDYLPNGGFINPYVGHKDNSNFTADRNAEGTNYWEQSSLRTYLNDGFIDGTTMYDNDGASWFDENEKAAIVKAPKVKTILPWIELTSAFNDLNYVLLNFYDPTATSYIVKDSSGTMVDPNYTTAMEYSGKATIYVNASGLDNGKHDYVMGYINSNSILRNIYNKSSFYYSTDAVFLAPMTTVADANDNYQLKNPIGNDFVSQTDYNSTNDADKIANGAKKGLITFNSLPENYGNSGSTAGIERVGVMLALTDGENGDHSYVRSSDYAKNSYAFSPSVYISNDTVLERTGSSTNIGESNEVGMYKLSGETYGSGEAQEPVIEGSRLSEGKIQEEYSERLKSNLIDNVVWEIIEGSLPSGYNLDEESGVISGVTQELGKYVIMVRAYNNFGSDEKELELEVVKKDALSPNIEYKIELKGEVGQRLKELENQLPIGFRFVRGEYELKGAGVFEDIEVVYNEDSNIYKDSEPIKIMVVVYAKGGADETSPQKDKKNNNWIVELIMIAMGCILIGLVITLAIIKRKSKE